MKISINEKTGAINMTMSRSKFDRVSAGLTATARKVYQAVPISEHWGINKIIAELQRMGIGMDYKLVAGCVNSLIDAGMVCEPKKNEFRREAIRENTAPKKDEKEDDDMKQVISIKPNTPPAPAPIIEPAIRAANPLERLADLAERAEGMMAQMKQLSDDIADAAIEIQAQLDANTEKVRKAKQAFAAFKEMSELSL